MRHLFASIEKHSFDFPVTQKTNKRDSRNIYKNQEGRKKKNIEKLLHNLVSPIESGTNIFRNISMLDTNLEHQSEEEHMIQHDQELIIITLIPPRFL